MSHHRIIIIGGGVAGLACARHLQDNGETDFLVVTDDVGGRATASQDAINFGAFYARTDYRHIWPYVTTRRRVRIWDGIFITQYGPVTARQICLKHPIVSANFLLRLLQFDRHFQRFKRRCEVMSHKRALEADPYLLSLYQQPALEYITSNRLTVIRDELIAPVLRVSTFQDLNQLSAMVMFMMTLIVFRKAHECSFDSQTLIAPFQNKILLAGVEAIRRQSDGWIVTTNTAGKLSADVVVMATPVHITHKLIGRPQSYNCPKTVHMAHLRGVARAPFGEQQYTALPLQGDDIAIVNYKDGTFLFCSRRPNYDLSEYFHSHQVIAKKFWNPAFFIGSTLVESKLDPSLYLIGDFVIGGMELAYLSGKYAANEICNSPNDQQLP